MKILLTAAMLLGTCALLAGCLPRKDFSSMPAPNVITVQESNGRYVAIPPDCEKLLQPSQSNSAHNLRPDIAFGCATYTNLAAQVANPRDLVQPAAYAGQHADTADSAVTRYREDKVTPLRETKSTNAGSGN
jgi:type IV pilus biogenesis protein CpaD/CtpE